MLSSKFKSVALKVIDKRMATLLLSIILTVSFVLRVTDGQGEVTERVCVSYITSVLI